MLKFKCGRMVHKRSRWRCNDSSMTSLGEMHGLFNGSETGALTLGLDPCRVTLHIIADPHEICPLLDLYQPIVDWVDPNLRLFRVTERSSALGNSSKENPHNSSDVPALAVMVFLQGSDPDSEDSKEGRDRIQEARSLFKRPPWRFHHSEKLSHGKINALPNNTQEFFYTSSDLPLWAIRHVHYGSEHLRYVLYVLDSSWPDQVHFYRLILGIEPDLLREDFCLFTVYRHEAYDVQFCLKKLDQSARIMTLDSVHIQIKVKDVGQLVPLFPNVCRPISDVKWQTTDHDGNIVVLDVINPMNASSDTRNSSQQTHTWFKSDTGTSGKTRKYNSLGPNSGLINSGNSNPSTQASVSSLISELTVRLANVQQFDNTALSDSDDLDLDLPSPPLRVTTTQEEDEESLTLTNTSEESGIQMQHGSEDLSFCDEEPLRPILNKNPSSSKFKTKFKVRFKEEVEAFEDDPYSRLSSGIDSEDQSDVEMETRFPYLPPQESSNDSVSSTNFSSSSHDTSKATSSACSSQRSGTETKRLFSSKSSTVQRSKPVHLSADLEHMQSHSKDADSHKAGTQAGQTARVAVVSTVFPSRDQHTPARSSSPSTDNSRGVSTREGAVEKTQTGSRAQRSSGDLGPGPNRPALPPYPEHMKRKPPSYHTAISRPQTPNNLQKSVSQENVRLSSDSSTNGQHLPHPQLTRSSTQPSLHSQLDIQHKTRSSSCQNLPKKDSAPPPPPVRDSKTRLRSVDSNNLPQNNTTRVRTTQGETAEQTLQNQNAQRKLYFADPSANLSTKGAKSAAQAEEETTLKFTLKFDTCPTSGLSCRQEQIGFYV